MKKKHLFYRMFGKIAFVYTSEELNPHACGFILYDCKPFTELKRALRAVSILQWCIYVLDFHNITRYFMKKV